MHKINQVFPVVALGLLASLSSAQALSITVSDTAPTDRIEISSTNAVDPGDQYTRTYNGPGQTFTIAPGGGFNISSMTFRINSTTGSLANTTWTAYMGIASLSNPPPSILQQESLFTATDFAAGSAGKYITFTLATPYTLGPGIYGFGIANSGANVSNYLQFSQSPDSEAYTGGGGYWVDSQGAPNRTFRDATFFVGSSAVPEPSDWALIPVLGTVAFLAWRRFAWRRFKTQAAV